MDAAKLMFTIDGMRPIYSKYASDTDIHQTEYYHTMQYLYHISRYRMDGFNYIICWLSNMIRYMANNIIDNNLFRSVLILRGGERSGKEIFLIKLLNRFLEVSIA